MDISSLYFKFTHSSGVSIDTRTIKKDNIFFALKGPSFDGNQYAQLALDSGASCVVIDDPLVLDKNNKEVYILVDNVLQTLQSLAKYHRELLNIPIVALTGSNGKTTTKELIYQVLSKKFNVLATKGNLNNHIGVPLTLLSIDATHDIAIIEMGANHVGEIESYCLYTKPNYGLITNIGKAHIGEFGGFNNIIKAKFELFDFIKLNKGIMVYNESDELLSEKIAVYPNAQAYNPEDFIISNSKDLTLSYANHGTEVKTQLIGNFNIFNISAAVKIGELFSVEEEEVHTAISNYEPSNMRSQIVHKNKLSFILDTYNANPTSMKISLESFFNLDLNSRIVILGEMLELGEDSYMEHKNLVNLVLSNEHDQLILVGKEFEKIAKEINVNNWYETTDDLISYLKFNPINSGYVFVKGSRKNKLERILDHTSL